MANYSIKCVVSLMVWTLATPLLPLAWAADDLEFDPIRRTGLGLFVWLHPAIDPTRWVCECDYR